MNPIRTRPSPARPTLALVASMFLVLFLVTFLVTAAPTASGAAAVPPPQVQAVVGGGTGTKTQISSHDRTWDGNFTSPTQLGRGHYRFGDKNSAASFTRVDGMTLTGYITGPSPLACATEDPKVDCLDVFLTGTADIASAHLFISVANQGSTGTNTFKTGLIIQGTLTLRQRTGYVMVDGIGNTYAFGGVDALGGGPAPGTTDIELTPSGAGYWTVDAAGHVAGFGDAKVVNKVPVLRSGERVTSMSSTPSGNGYWMFTSRGRVFLAGDARAFGDLSAVTLNGPVVGSVATPTGNGYYMVGADGGVFAFGDAHFHGSMGAAHLNQPVVGIVPNRANTGYWLAAADGGIFAFAAPFLGSMGGTHLNRPVVGVVRYGPGYLLVARDGGIFDFSTAPFFASLGGTTVPPNVVGAAAIG